MMTMGHFGGPFFSNLTMKVRSLLWVLSLCLVACAGQKVPIGIQSTFTLQDHHLWHEDIGDEFIQAFEGCCYNDALPIFLHRVIQDERGWVMFIGAGELTSKGEIASVFGDPFTVRVKDMPLSTWEWPLNDDIHVIRYAYDEPKSGLLITMDCVLPPYVSHEEAKAQIIEDLTSCLSVK